MATETGATPLVRAGRLQSRHYIDTHKALVIPVALALTAAYDEWSNGLLWIYVGLHGTYTICRLMKSRFFPDPAWEEFLPAGERALPDPRSTLGPCVPRRLRSRETIYLRAEAGRRRGLSGRDLVGFGH